jgi:hypothetical protein
MLSQLKSLLEKTEQLKGKFSKVYPTDGQWDTLSDFESKALGSFESGSR